MQYVLKIHSTKILQIHTTKWTIVNYTYIYDHPLLKYVLLEYYHILPKCTSNTRILPYIIKMHYILRKLHYTILENTIHYPNALYITRIHYIIFKYSKYYEMNNIIYVLKYYRILPKCNLCYTNTRILPSITQLH